MSPPRTTGPTADEGHAPGRTRPAPVRGTWLLRDRPPVAWLVLAVALTLVHPFVPGSRWLMVHLVLLGALTHSVMVWSTHFTQALLKTSEGLDPRPRQNARLTMLLVGTTLVLVGVPASWWPVTVVGASLVATAVLWHGAMLWRRLRAALPGRFRVTVRYYLAAVACLPVGAALGATLASGLSDAWHGRLLVAHSMVMVLGWVGLTVTGTLVTLWPTILRTRIDERAETLAAQALPVLLVAVAGLGTAASLGLQWGVVGFLVLYAVGLGWWGRALWRPARVAPPRRFATWSVTAALGWWVLALVVLAVRVGGSRTWAEVTDSYGTVAAMVAAGLGVQLLTGALSYLVPMVLGGGPSVFRAGQAWLERWAVWRVATINLGLLVCLLPVPSVVRVVVSTLVLVAMALFIPLLLLAVRAMVAARRALVEAVAAAPGSRPRLSGPEQPSWSPAQLVGALATLAVAVSLGVAADPGALGLGTGGATGVAGQGDLAAGVTPTGRTTAVTVTAHDRHFTPSAISVPAGDRLVVTLVNADSGSPHDLAFDNGTRTRRLMPGERERLDVGVVGVPTQGWCTIVGHRQMGMVLDVRVTGAAAAAAGGAGAGGAGAGGAGAASGGTGATAGATTATGAGAGPDGIRPDPASPSMPHVDAALPPLGPERIHKRTITIREVELLVAPGVRQRRWTFDGTVPGPLLHGRVGDTFEITLVNRGTMGHSIDFHAGERAPDEVMRTIPPGQSLTYRFTARRAGIWMYHCSTMPMTAHIAAGLFGAVVIEPDALPRVARSYVLLQSEAYVDGTGRSPVREVDASAVAAGAAPDALSFNGIASQYDAHQLPATVGERVRVWVLDAGPNRPGSFHVVGGQFDTVWTEGAYTLRRGRDAFGDRHGGAQVLPLLPAQGGFVELTFPEPGHYPFVSHVMADAERGAHGVFRVTR